MALKWYGDEVIEKMHNATRLGIDETTAICVGIAKARVTRDTTALQGSLQMRPARRIGARMVGEWGSYNYLAAIFVELGTEPHFPPVEALKPWARRNLGDEALAYPVAKSIAVHGTKPQPFLRPTADEQYPLLTGRIRLHYGS